MKFFKFPLCAALFSALFSVNPACFADDQIPPGESAQTVPATEEAGWFTRTKDKLVKGAENIYDNGRLSLILSGYAHHGRSTYTSEKLTEFNEKAWGLGISKIMRDDKDNEEALEFLVLSDSHAKPQINAVYSYQWMMPLGSRLEAGIGYTAGLFHRRDIIGGIPFPGILPLATFGTRDTKLVVSYIPRLSANKGNGDVLYLALRVGLN